MVAQSVMIPNITSNSAAGTLDQTDVDDTPSQFASDTASSESIPPTSVPAELPKLQPACTSATTSVSPITRLRPGVSFAQVVSSKPVSRKTAAEKATAWNIPSTTGLHALVPSKHSRNSIAVGGITFTNVSGSRPPSRAGYTLSDIPPALESVLPSAAAANPVKTVVPNALVTKRRASNNETFCHFVVTSPGGRIERWTQSASNNPSGHTTPSLADSEFMQDAASVCTTPSSSPEPVEEEKPLRGMESKEIVRYEPIDGPRRSWPIEDYCQIWQPHHVRPACTAPGNWPKDDITPSKFENYPPLTCYLLQEEVERIVDVFRQMETHFEEDDAPYSAALPSQEFNDHVDRGRRLLRYLIYQFCLDIGLVKDDAKKLTDTVTSVRTLARVCHESLILYLALGARIPSAFGTPFSAEYAAKAFTASIALIHDAFLGELLALAHQLTPARAVDEKFATQIMIWTLLPWIHRALDTVIISGMSEACRAESASKLMHNIAKVRGRV